jgi:hypothetical protein
MIYPYISHYLYDLLVIGIALLAGRAMFNLKFSKGQFFLFLIWMIFFYQLNFYITETFLPKEFKYIILYIGMTSAYILVLKLNWVAALIVIMTTTALNGIWTNINMAWMLRFLFDNYGQALEAKHLQYTCYTLSVTILNGSIALFKLHILDLKRYN